MSYFTEIVEHVDGVSPMCSDKFLDIEAEVQCWARWVAGGHLEPGRRFMLKPEPHHRRARDIDRTGKVRWIDVTFDLYDVTTMVYEAAARIASST